MKVLTTTRTTLLLLGMEAKTSCDTSKSSPSSVAEVEENYEVHEAVRMLRCKKDPPLYIYFHPGTTEAQRNFIYQVLNHFSDATTQVQFSQLPVDVMIGLDPGVRAPCYNNRSSEQPIKIIFVRAEAISSAINVIQNQRNIKWAADQQHLPKFYLRIGFKSHFMEVM